VKPVLITDTNLTDDELSKIKMDYEMDEIFNYNTKNKEETRNFFVNLLVEIL